MDGIASANVDKVLQWNLGAKDPEIARAESLGVNLGKVGGQKAGQLVPAPICQPLFHREHVKAPRPRTRRANIGVPDMEGEGKVVLIRFDSPRDVSPELGLILNRNDARHLGNRAIG
jgi:hypothetical protein